MSSESDLALIEPSLEWQHELRCYIDAFRAEGLDKLHGLFPAELFDTPATLIGRLCEYSRGENLNQGWVPSSTWFAAKGRIIVGNINLRHRLTPFLEKMGGQVGYSVHPQHRNKGHATRMLALLLPHARGLGLQRLLITCDDTNVASARVIEKNGGVLSDKIPRDGGALGRRYWVEL